MLIFLVLWKLHLHSSPSTISIWTLLASASISGPICHSPPQVHLPPGVCPCPLELESSNFSQTCEETTHSKSHQTFCLTEEIFMINRDSPSFVPCRSFWLHSLLTLTKKTPPVIFCIWVVLVPGITNSGLKPKTNLTKRTEWLCQSSESWLETNRINQTLRALNNKIGQHYLSYKRS